MKTLEEIKKEHANKFHHADWGSFLVTQKMNDWKLLDFHLNEVLKEYQKQESGVLLITVERNEKQILKHGFTGEHHALHPEWYDKGQLIEASIKLSYTIANDEAPENWDSEWFSKLCAKPHKERLVISGALIAGELDRLIWLENTLTPKTIKPYLK